MPLMMILRLLGRLIAAPLRHRCTGLLVIAFATAQVCVAEESVLCDVGQSGGVIVNVMDGEWSVTARDVPLVEVLQRIADEARFEVVAAADVDCEKGSWSIAGRPLHHVVEALTRRSSAVIVYEASDSGSGPRLARVYLLGAESSPVESAVVVDAVGLDLEGVEPVDEDQSSGFQERLLAIEGMIRLTGNEAVDNLALTLARDPDPEVRKQAAQDLGLIGGEVGATALEIGLGDGDASVRIQVLQSLAGIGDERISFWLGQALFGDEKIDVRAAAVRALRLRSDVAAGHFLIAAAEDEALSAI